MEMHKIINIAIGLIMIIFILFNVKIQIDNYNIQNLNVMAMETSAVKAWCDPVTNNPCVIRLGGILAEGVGQPRAQY